MVTALLPPAASSGVFDSAHVLTGPHSTNFGQHGQDTDAQDTVLESLKVTYFNSGLRHIGPHTDFIKAEFILRTDDKFTAGKTTLAPARVSVRLETDRRTGQVNTVVHADVKDWIETEANSRYENKAVFRERYRTADGNNTVGLTTTIHIGDVPGHVVLQFRNSAEEQIAEVAIFPNGTMQSSGSILMFTRNTNHEPVLVSHKTKQEENKKLSPENRERANFL